MKEEQISFKIPVSLKLKLKAMAKKELRPLCSQITKILTEATESKNAN